MSPRIPYPPPSHRLFSSAFSLYLKIVDNDVNPVEVGDDNVHYESKRKSNLKWISELNREMRFRINPNYLFHIIVDPGSEDRGSFFW